jgi:hypothetical protein
MLHNELAVIDDIEQDDRVPIEAYRSTYVRSMVVVPIAGPNGPAAATSGAIEDIGLGNAPWAPNFRTRFPAAAR